MAVITADPDPTTFNQLPLSPSILTVLDEIGYQYATPVQAGSIVPALEGRDLMVQSQTGTGKTAAFTLPLIERLKAVTEISALALTPTRELARQVAQEAERLAAQTPGFGVSCVYGGVSFDKQVVEIKAKPTLVVGTPGRVLDHLRRRTLSLKSLSCFVLDEADEMLSMGFAEELDEILSYLPSERQTLLFSATFPNSVKRYAKKTLRDPLSLSFLEELSSADELEHYYMLIPGVARGQHLVNLIHEVNPESALVFTNTRRDASQVTQRLKRAGITAAKLSGDMDQSERDRVMKKIKSKSIKLVVATDVAARGIDISQLSHVFHYQLPNQPEVYVHRSGRTGRAGSKGVVISLASSQDLGVIHVLRRAHHINLIERALPQSASPASSSSPRPSSIRTSSEHSSSTRSGVSTSAASGAPSTSNSDLKPRTANRESTKTRERIRDKKDMVAKSTTPEVLEASVLAEEPPNKVESKKGQPSSLPKRRRRRTGSSKNQTLSVPLPAQREDVDTTSTLQGMSEVSKLTQSPDQRPHIDLGFLSEELSALTFSEMSQLASDLDQHDQSQAVLLNIFTAIKASNQERISKKNREPRRSRVDSSSRSSDSNQTADTSDQMYDRSESQDDTHASGDTERQPQWLYINLGWRDCNGGFSAIKELIAELGGLLPEDITQIKVKDRHSLIVVDPMFWDDLTAAINGEYYNDKKLRLELAKSSS